MKSDRTVVFRCDASAQIGGGHVVRCMALAEAFRDAGANIVFAVSEETLRTVGQLASGPDAVMASMSGEGSDWHSLLGAFPQGIEALIVDHYGLGEAFEQRAGGWARSVVAIDDFPTRRHTVTHLVDTTLGREPREYRGLVPDDAILMCGSPFAMLRKPFRTHRNAPEPRLANDGRLRLFISFGMTDSVDMTGLVLDALVPIRDQVDIEIALGSTAPHIGDVHRRIAAFDNARLLADASAEAMASMTARCDLAIGAPGSASYERCCLGKPSLLVQIADNQAGNAASLVSAGAAELVGVYPDITTASIRLAVVRLQRDGARRAALAAAASQVTDGCGTRRIVDQVLQRRA